MKKLNKLQINTEKIMNEEELITLRGGYEGCTCFCIPGGYLASSTRDCGPECYEAFGSSGSCLN